MRRYVVLLLLLPFIAFADEQPTLTEQINTLAAAHLSANNLIGQPVKLPIAALKQAAIF